MSLSVDTPKIVWNRSVLKTIADQAGDDSTGAAGPLSGSLQRLLTSTVTVNSDTPFASLSFADFGDSSVALTYTDAFNHDSTRIAKKAQIEAYAGADPTAQEITGVAVVNAAADDWICAYSFNDPVTIAKEGDGVSVDVFLAFALEPQSGLTE